MKSKLRQVPTFKYRHLIKQLCVDLSAIPNFAGTTVAILLKSGEKTWLSSTPKVTLKLIAMGLYRGDQLLNYRYLGHSRVIFPEEFIETDDLQSSINKVCEEHQLYRAYCIVRSCSDCSVLATCNTNKKLTHYQDFYQNSIDRLEKFANIFLDKTISIYMDEMPALAKSRFSTDLHYRHQVITTRHVTEQMVKLSSSELDVLYWSAQGKGASEIAVITGLTINTVNTYRQRLMEKLNAGNITQAVYLAAQAGLIV